jgi:hypothetical protein
MEYDPELCITAGELREIGTEIPDDIPDHAWVPRVSLSHKPGKPTVGSDGSIGFTVAIQVNESFRWVPVH